MAEVELEVHERWAEVVLNRPEVKNAINGPLGIELAGALTRADEAPDVQVIVLRGAGGSFCSGLDLKAFNADPAPPWMGEWGSIWRRAHKALFETQKPVIAALERFAINGGAALALAADLLVVGEKAFLQVGEVQQGMAAPYNISWLRLRMSEMVAAQLTLVGRRFSGAELKAMGIAYEVCDDDAVIGRARELATQLAGYPDGAAAKIKTMLRRYHSTPADAWFDRATGPDRGQPRQAPRAVE